MNLLCPNCQKPLTVPEQYAGQPMRCPLCSGTFTVPALPTSAAPPATATAPLPPPIVAASAPADTYGLKDPVAPPPSLAPSSPVSDLVLEELPPSPRAPSTSRGGAPTSGPQPTFTEAQPSYPSTPTPEGYQRKYTIWFSPKILQYVAPVAVLLVFVLTFFPWVGFYPGGVADAWQNAWQAAFPFFGYGSDPDVVVAVPPFPKYTEKDVEKSTEPGYNVLLIFYLLILIPTFLIALGCLALRFVPPAKLPPAAHPILPWRWGLVAGLNLILLLFLILQLVLGFSLVNNVLAATDSKIAARAEKREAGVTTTTQARQDAIDRGLVRQELRRTIWLDLVVFLHLVALAGAGLMFWINRRGSRPAPRLDTLW
jgi:hypothetical protein